MEPAALYAYDDRFFAVADRTAAASADGILRCLPAELKIGSVLDLGCGRGVWLARWVAHGVGDILGIDGPYVDVDKLHVPSSAFLARDLGHPLALDRQFDLVQSLEVAEHLEATAADQFVDNLVRHGNLILFSAAVPGQGGEFHVNEQPWEYWRAKFAARGFELFDFVRPIITDDRTIFFWYRHNILLYAHRSIIASLPPAIRATHVASGHPVANYLPAWAKLRTALIGCLPRSAVDRLARLKYRLMSRAAGA
jgi:SAM-dependent methyltransferase